MGNTNVLQDKTLITQDCLRGLGSVEINSDVTLGANAPCVTESVWDTAVLGYEL